MQRYINLHLTYLLTVEAVNALAQCNKLCMKIIS